MEIPNLSEKHKRLYMKIAKTLSESEHNSCLSRHIGVVIVRPDIGGGRIVSTGYNGPSSGMPKPNSAEHVDNVIAKIATDAELDTAVGHLCDTPKLPKSQKLELLKELLQQHPEVCPRRLLGADSGERLELCGCAHAEENAIVRTTENLVGCVMFCWCGIPCEACMRKINNSGIKHLVVLNSGGCDYSAQSRYIAEQAGISIEGRWPETLDVISNIIND